MKDNNAATYNYVDYYLATIRAKGSFVFTLDKLRDEYQNYSDKTLLQSLFRWKIIKVYTTDSCIRISAQDTIGLSTAILNQTST